MLNDELRPDEGVRPPPGLTLQKPVALSHTMDAEGRACVTVAPVVLNDAKTIIGVAGITAKQKQCRIRIKGVKKSQRTDTAMERR